MLTRILDREVAGCKTNVTQVVDAGNRLTLYASIGMSYYPFRERSVGWRSTTRSAACCPPRSPVGACRCVTEQAPDRGTDSADLPQRQPGQEPSPTVRTVRW